MIEIDADEALGEPWPVYSATLGLALLATAAAELAIAEPGRPPIVALGWALGGFVVAIGAGFAIDRRGDSGQSTRPIEVLALVSAMLGPPAIELGRWAIAGRWEPLEVVLLGSLRNLGLGLAALGSRPATGRLAALASLFLVLVSGAIAEGPIAAAILAGYAALGATWLGLSSWRGLGRPATARSAGRSPIAPMVAMLGVVALAVAAAAVGPTRAATALAGLLPSSGGTSWDNPDARGGVNDGENEVKSSDQPDSVGFAESDVYLDSDRPSLYDAFNDMYGEPVRPKRQDPMIALSNANVVEQLRRPAENLRAGRSFATVRKKAARDARRPGDLGARAFLYVRGPTPLHLPLIAFDRFDGRDWAEEGPDSGRLPLAPEPGGTGWLRLDRGEPAGLGPAATHEIKLAALDTAVLPLPPNPTRFRLGRVDRPDFFGWSQDGLIRMVGRTIPATTTIEAESRPADPVALRMVTFPSAPYASPRYEGDPAGYRPDPAVLALARGWLGGAGLPLWPDRAGGWREVEAVVTGVRGRAALDPTAALPEGVDDVVAEFLLRSRRGPDYLFATSAAVLLRSIGYPTRLVTGFYAAPARYDRRTRHTPVSAGDAHAWVEVRLADGTWIPVEPTPGYETPEPPASLAERARAAARGLGRWVVARRVPLGVAEALLGLAFWRRRDLLDAAGTLLWRARLARGGSDPRRAAVEALRLVDRRSRWAGRPRPPGATPRRWYRPIAPGPIDGLANDFDRLLGLAEWGLYAPPDSPPPEKDPAVALRRAVRRWSLRVFRGLARPNTLPELAP